MIKATIIQDSISQHTGVRLTTMELEYPRFIHSEFMTHRMLSKNAASSRAIPVRAMHENIIADTATPVHWGANQSGMQAKQEVDPFTKEAAKALWFAARDSAISFAKVMHDMNVHKQIVNRITEPFTTMKVVCSGTEWNNLLHLRYHPDAQPEFFELAKLIAHNLQEHKPLEIKEGMWHVPYINREIINDTMVYSINGTPVSLDDAITVSASCCAQVSYRKNDESMEKAKKIFDWLITASPMHASPVEHQGTPIPRMIEGSEVNKGITHKRFKDKTLWSGNFRSWIQYRQLLDNHTKW